VPQVVLHVGRDRDKRRRLSEIAVLRAGEDGRVRVATAWHVDTGFGSAAGDLRNMVRDRGVVTGAALALALALLVLPPSARPRLVALQMVSHARQRIVACHVHGTV
jgi:hypothetical protein